MAVIKNINEVMHRIRVKLYPNYLPQVDGAYIARTSNEAALTIEQVCAALKNRGGFTGNYEELVDNVRQFMDESAYQLCDGFAVNTGYFSILPNIGGTFSSAKEVHDPKKHPVSFRFRTHAKLRRLANHIEVEVEGLADTSGFIDEFTDVGSDTINEALSGGDQFIISGHKIKVAGDHPDCGVYFQLVEEPDTRIKVKTRFAENSKSRIIGVVPVLLAPKSYRVVVVTQFNGSSGTYSKTPKTMTSNFQLLAA